MHRAINVALLALMAVLVFVAGLAIWAVFVAGGNFEDGPTPLFFKAVRTFVFALGALAITGSLFSIHKRLAAIEAKLDH